ncbi:MAG: hypothetical protein B7C24_07045 [Bacteroidetes bacterium 4572_77]|nr:MAG: hypothetical protein B7C24_07045 [Bacteroidetes bacterium 4572_77]
MIKELKPTKKRSSYFFRELFVFLLLILSIQIFSAEKDIQQLEDDLPAMHDDTLKVNVLLKLGEHYCSIENDKALMYLQDAFSLATTLNYTSGIGRCLLWQGRVYYYKDDYPLSNIYYEKAEKILKGTHEWDALAFLYFIKAVNYNIRGDYIHALEMYNEAIVISKKTSNKKLMSTCYCGIGTVLLDRKETKKAMAYFEETLSIQKAIDDQKGISDTYTMGRYSEAEESLQIAMNKYGKLEEKTGIVISKLRLAVALSKQEKTGAIQTAINALDLANKIDNPNLISHAYKILSEIYVDAYNYEESYNYLILHKKIQDSLFDTEKERMLTEFEIKFQSDRKDNEIKLLKSKAVIQQKNNILLLVLIMVFAIVIVLLFFMFRLKSLAFNRQQTLMKQDKIIHAQESELVEKENMLLHKQLETKNRELASKALEMLRFNDTISIVIEKLEGFKSKVHKSPEESDYIRSIIYELENQTKQNIWSEFDKIFKNIHSDFYNKLLEICPNLTASEIKIAALLKLNLSTKEIAAITFKSEGGIKTTRYRLRKKLALTSDENLVPFLMKI